MSTTLDDEPPALHYLRIPRQQRGIPVPEFVRHPRKRMEKHKMQQRYCYAVSLARPADPEVYRFAYPSDRSLWVAQGPPGERRSLAWNDPLVLAAKDAAELGTSIWPTPVWE